MAVPIPQDRPPAIEDKDEGTLFQIAAPDSESNSAKRKKPVCVTKYMRFSSVPSSNEVVGNRDTKQILPARRKPSKVEEYAAEIRGRLETQKSRGTAEDYLTTPLLECDFGGVPSIPLITWIFFNRLRPTMESLFFTRVGGTGEGLLMFQQKFPSEPARYAVYGLMPDDGGIDNAMQAAFALFKANGHPALPLFQGLPTSVFHWNNWDSDGPPAFRSGLARVLFRCTAASLWPADMPKICDHLRRHPDPWKRILVENAHRAFAHDNAVQTKGVFGEVQYNDWFDLVTDPTHIESERTIFRLDWQEEQVRNQRERRLIVN